MIFSVTILGSSSALPTSNRFPSAHVLTAHERLFLIDCAEGTQMQLRRYHIKMSRIDNIFISHLHGDHVLGLTGLISTYNLLGRKKSLHVYAHPDLEHNLFSNIEFYLNDIQFKVQFHSIDPLRKDVIYDDGKVTVTTIPLRHRVPTAGFLFAEKRPLKNIRKECIARYGLSLADIGRIKNGEDYITPEGEVVPNDHLAYYSAEPRSYAYCADTLYSERVVGMVKGVDLLYHEATFAHEDAKLARATGHSTAAQAATVALKARVGKLLIGHYSSRYKDEKQLVQEAQAIFPNTVGVEDGSTFEVAEKRIACV